MTQQMINPTALRPILAPANRVIHLGDEELDLRELVRETGSLRGVKFTGTLGFPHMEDLDLRDTDWRGINLQGAQFQRARLGGANFSGAWMDCVNLSGASVAGAVFADTQLKYATVKHASFERALLWRTRLSGTRLTSAQLHAAHTVGTEMVLCSLLTREPGLAGELRGSLEAGKGCVPGMALDAALGRHSDLDGDALRLWVMTLRPGCSQKHPTAQMTLAWITAWEERRRKGWN
ncbi:hypothetical protein DESA109040_02460 [Deinococcus saxicola]|uniref:pentapeptide repeat-containing protein n=1 Tax=Deinococcus saxicola TaxID=249406 RepID=UPI0039F12B57